MRFLFFFVHPAKYHFFRPVINRLLQDGHKVKVVIVSKDVLELLVQKEKWDYVNLFPNGRRSRTTGGLSIVLSTVMNVFRTLWRLNSLMAKERYDLVVTDDLATCVAKVRGIPSVAFTDNELTTVPEYRLILMFADRILAPRAVDLGPYNRKKDTFNGYKESTYLHPNHFLPDNRILTELGVQSESYFLIRSVSMTASHDIGLTGLNDDRLRELIRLLAPHGRVFISSERPLSSDLQGYTLPTTPESILSVVFYARIFIGDSGTMSSEAALLGIPSLMFHAFVGRLGVMREKEEKYGLMFGFNEQQFPQMVEKLKELLATVNIKDIWQQKRLAMFAVQDDVNELLHRYFLTFKR